MPSLTVGELSPGGEGRVAVALSGGGHRASLFGLGVLVYLADCGKNRSVASIASVSGGSLTNACVAQELDFSASTPADFRRVAAVVTTQVGQRGTLWAVRGTWAYVVLLPLGGLAALVAVVRFVEIALAWRICAIVGVLLLVSMLARMRGRVCASAFAKTLLSRGGKPTKLSEVNHSVDHVICATELHSGEHLYFSGRFVCSYRFGFGVPGNLGLHDAVQASAAFPGAFPPRWFPAQRHRFSEAGDERARGTRRLVLVDGGTYDNMGTEWALGVPRRNREWGAGLNEADELVVVNSSAPLDWSSTRLLLLPLVNEVVALKRDIDVLYDTTTSTRRRWLFDTFGSDEGRMRGAFVQISQSPFHVARQFAQGHDDAAQRARAVLGSLGDTERSWDEVVRANSTVKTTLSKLGGEVAARLVHHGYALAMANLHVVLGYPLLDMPPREDFERLAGVRP